MKQEMPLTKTKIVSVVELLKNYGCLANLTDHEQQTILQELKNIAGTAIMEVNNHLQNILPDSYKTITE